MDNSNSLKNSANLLDDLESIRQLLGDDSPPTPGNGEGQIPLLFDVVGAKPALAEELDFGGDEADIPTLTPEPAVAAAPAPAPQQAVSKEDTLLHLDTELRDAAQLIMQDVIDDFAPHIETEIKRRLEARLERLLSQYQN
ncbi:hypothetical protein [Pseudomonas syringae]|uniref:DNA polymerase III subunit chi n=1 Tax=Pseudomonas syringae TaxID=317 RepID=A0A085VML9_PSESX|nr:hypothetical protein [Pseudomonas syringae]KFE56682.1 DNA polymerase III subunit chi [Pseudomonas syringae]